MASKASAKTALLLSLNLVLFTLLTSVPSSSATCFKDTLKLEACANVLNLVRLRLGDPPKPCCYLIEDLVKLEARACLCTTLNVDLMRLLKLKIPLDINLLLSKCNYHGIRCPK